MESSKNYFQFRNAYFSDAVNKCKFEYIKEYVLKHKPEKILDVGSGNGIISLELHKIAKEVHGLEYQEENLSIANHFKNETEIDNVFFIKGDGKKIPFPDNSFDMVICSQVLEHVENPHEIIEELSRVSKKIVLIDVPTPLWEAWQFLWWSWNKIKHPKRTMKRYKEVKHEGKASFKRALQPGHVNKWSPWKWRDLIERYLDINETASCYMSLTKKFNMLGPLEKKHRKSKPFNYMGMVFMVEAQKGS